MNKIKDALAFARQRQVLEGSSPLDTLERLHDRLLDTTGLVAYRLVGSVGFKNEPLLHLEIKGLFLLPCQRCLQSVAFDLDVQALLQLVDEKVDVSQEELEDDTRDFLSVVGELSVDELVEDEILLALPIAPRHVDCHLPGMNESGEKIGAFSVLSSLLMKND